MRRPRSYTYPQHELVADWAGQLLDAGGDLRFGVEVTGVEQSEDGAVVSAVRDTVPVTVECEAVVAGDGAGSILSSGEAAVSAVYPARWLTLIAAVPPSAGGAIYGLHARGCAGRFHRSAAMTRFMLEMPVGEGYGQWDDGRSWNSAWPRPASRRSSGASSPNGTSSTTGCACAIPCSTAFPDRFPSHLLGSPSARSPAQLTGHGASLSRQASLRDVLR